MTKRMPGNYALDELTSDIDGSRAYRVSDPDVAGSWERAQIEPATDLEWVADDGDDDDHEVAITTDALAVLIARGSAHCYGCDGECAR